MAYSKEKVGHNSPDDSTMTKSTYQRPTAGQYLASRITTLRIPKEKALNPYRLLRTLDRKQWLFFIVSFLAWTWDSFDSYTVTLTIEPLAESFNKSVKHITWAISVALMLRPVGAIIFGIASDRYGRKWPFIINNIMFMFLELGTGFCRTFEQFLAVRALFGIALGGIYANSVATAMEDCPTEARGLISGMLQQGHSIGYLLATAVARGLVDTTSYGWRPLFWFAACPPIMVVVMRFYLPETEGFASLEAARKEAREASTTTRIRRHVQEGKSAFRRHWLLFIYVVCMTTGFSFISRGTQDLYPTMLRNQYNFGPNAVTITQIVSHLGSLTGGITIGYCSQIFGRRLCIIVMCCVGASLLYPYTSIPNHSIIAVAFFEQFAVHGATGAVPIHLMELSPGSSRTSFIGVAHQLGNLISSPSATMLAAMGERFPLSSKRLASGKIIHRYDYGKVTCIFVACAYFYQTVVIFLGPERRGRRLDFDDHEDHDEDHLVKSKGEKDAVGVKTRSV